MVDRSKIVCGQCGAVVSGTAKGDAVICPRCRRSRDDSEISPFITVSQSDPAEENNTLLETATEYGVDTKTSPAQQTSNTFGEYELLGEIARGGMGVVYKARQIKANRVVALKMILDRRLGGSGAIKRFKLEAEAAARLDHPNIVPVYDVGEFNGQHYFTMGFVDGESLKSLIQDGPLNGIRAAETLRELALAVAYAHSQGVIHRDIKPSNILIRQVGSPSRGSKSSTIGLSASEENHARPMITDFGLAKQIDSDSELTTSGQVMGTPQFMAPEQARGDIANIGAAADIYSLGATLYQLLTGRPPHLAPSVVDTLQQVLNEEPIPPSQFNSDIDRDLETICLKCLQKDQRRRYSSAQELADELQRFVNDEPILARPVGRIERAWRWCKRNPSTALLISAVISTLLIGISVSSALAWVANERATAATFQTKRANSNAEDFRRQRDLAKAEKKRADEKTIEAQEERDEVSRQKNKLREQLYLNLIASAHHQWQAGQIEAALSDLAACPEDLRGWEYDYLDTLFNKDHISIVEPLGLTCLAYSRDGKILATGNQNGSVKLWDTNSGREILTLVKRAARRGDNDIVGIAFSKYSRRLYTHSRNGVFRVWDTEIPLLLKSFNTGLSSDSCMALSPDERFIAVGGSEGGVTTFDIQSGKLVDSMEGFSGAIMTIGYSPNGKKIAAGGHESSIKIWDVETSKCDFTLHHDGIVDCLTFSPEGSQLASGTWSGSMYIWDCDTGEMLGGNIREAHDDRVDAIAFSSNGEHIVTAGRDRLIKVWGKEIQTPIHSLKGHAGNIDSVAFHPAGSQIASGGAPTLDRPTLKFWNIQERVDSFTQGAHIGGGVTSIAYSPDATKIASVGADRLLNVWDAKSGLRTLKTPIQGLIWSVAFSPDGKSLAAGGGQQFMNFSQEKYDIHVYDTVTGEVKNTMSGHTDSVNELRMSANGKRLYSCSDDTTIRAWNAETGEQIFVIKSKQGEKFSHLDYTPKGNLLVSGVGDTVTIWDAENGGHVKTLQSHDDHVWRVAFSNDGKKIVSGSGLGEIIVWETATGEKLHTMRRNPEPTRTLAFSPDDEKIVSCTNNLVVFWDANKGVSTLTLQQGEVLVNQAIFSPNGEHILTANTDGEILVYSATRRHEIQRNRNGAVKKAAQIKKMHAANQIAISKRVGGDGGGEFDFIAENGAFLVGLQCHLNYYENRPVVTGIDLIFQDVAGKEFSHFVGNRSYAVAASYAPPGCFVNGVSISAGDFINALQLHFKAFDPANAEPATTGIWLGRKFGPVTQLDFQENAVIGVGGAHGDIIDSLEIISTAE